MRSPQIRRHTMDGIPGWQHHSGRWFPLIAGAEEPDDDAAKAAAEKASADAAAAEKAAQDAEAARKAEEAKLGDAGKAALDAERKARKDAEKAAKEAQAKLKEIEDAKLSKEEAAAKRAEEAEAKVSTATDKLRKANLISALADKGLTGSKAKAAARLLDDVQYDDDDEPTNLDDAIKAAKAEYGDDQFKAVKPKPGDINSGGGGGEDRDGPSLTADELAAAKAADMTPEEYAAYKSTQPKLPAKST
jgi:hypothetical protein